MKRLDGNYLDFEFSINFCEFGMPLHTISVLLHQPTILSKVIPRFESKQGAGRPFLRWTTRQSQVQYFEKIGRVC